MSTINADVIESINSAGIDLSSCWLWSSEDIYSQDYLEVYNQPVSIEVVTLAQIRFKADLTTLTIRRSTSPTSSVVYNAEVYLNPDPTIDEPENKELQQISTGVVGSAAPNVVYGTGTITIESSVVNLYNNPTFLGEIKSHFITGATFTLTDNTEEYIVADYNGGYPIYRLESDKFAITDSDIVLIRICWRQGDNVHSVDTDCQGSALANKIEAALISTTPYRKSVDGGMVMTETSTPAPRTILISPSVVFAASTPHQIAAFNSSINKFTFVRHVSGVWTYSDVLVYDNTSYDNGTDLVTIGNNKYGVVWVYRSIGSDIQSFFVLGDTDYTSIQHAQISKMRSDLPLLLRDHCMLVGRIIIQKGATSGLVENVADVSFTSSSTLNHNDLANIQGTGPEYYHLSNTQYNDLTDTGDTSLHFHATDRNRDNHTGTQLANTISDFSTATDARITAQKGFALGLTPLDSGAKISTTYLPDSILGAMRYQTVWNANVNNPTLPTPTTTNKGYYWITSVSGTYNSVVYNVGDWVISNGVSYDKIDNTDSISSWNGRTGAIIPLKSDYSTWFVDLAGSYSNPSWITALDPAKITQTSSYRFVTDTEKATWNSKQAGSTVLTSIATLSTGTGLLKLTNGVASLDTNNYATTTQLGNYLPLTHSIGSTDLYSFTFTEGTNTGSLNLNLLDDNDGSESFRILNGAGNLIAGFYSNRVSNFYSIEENGVALSTKYQPVGNYVTLDTTQTVSGSKTFSTGLAITGGYLNSQWTIIGQSNLQINGTGSFGGIVRSQFDVDITSAGAFNIGHFVATRNENTSLPSNYAAGYGFHNVGYNGAFLYYDPTLASGQFKYITNNGATRTMWDSGNLTGTQNGHNHAGVYAAASHNHDWSNITGRTVGANPVNRLGSGWYEWAPTTTANGWPVDGSWWHLMSSTHSNGDNYFAFQIAADFFSQDFRIRSTNNNGLQAWSTIWTSSNFTPGNYLPLSAGSSKSLTGTLYGTAMVMSIGGSTSSVGLYQWPAATSRSFIGLASQDGTDGSWDGTTGLVIWSDYAVLSAKNNAGLRGAIGVNLTAGGITQISLTDSTIAMATRPTFNGYTPWDAGNFNFGDYPLAAPYTFEGIWPTGVTKTTENFAILWEKNGGATILSATDTLLFQTVLGTHRATHLKIDDTAITAYLPFSGDYGIKMLANKQLEFRAPASLANWMMIADGQVVFEIPQDGSRFQVNKPATMQAVSTTSLKITAQVTINNGDALPVVAVGEVIMLIGSTGGAAHRPVTNSTQACMYRNEAGDRVSSAAGAVTVNLDLYGRVAFLIGHSSTRATLLC